MTLPVCVSFVRAFCHFLLRASTRVMRPYRQVRRLPPAGSWARLSLPPLSDQQQPSYHNTDSSSVVASPSHAHADRGTVVSSTLLPETSKAKIVFSPCKAARSWPPASIAQDLAREVVCLPCLAFTSHPPNSISADCRSPPRLLSGSRGRFGRRDPQGTAWDKPTGLRVTPRA